MVVEERQATTNWAGRLAAMFECDDIPRILAVKALVTEALGISRWDAGGGVDTAHSAR